MTDEAYLVSKGWVYYKLMSSPRAWQQHGTATFWTMKDALETQRALDREAERKIGDKR